MEKPEILQLGPYPSWDIEALQKHFILYPYFEVEDKQTFLQSQAGRIRGIATRGELGADSALISALPNLEIIAIYGVGYDAVDMRAANARGIRVTNTPDVLTEDVADLGMAMMLATARGLTGASNWVRNGHWSKNGAFPLQTSVQGKRVGILGLGRIGSAVARRCAVFGMQIAYSNLAPISNEGDWQYFNNARALAEWSDFLFVTLTGGAATRHIVDSQVLKALGEDGVLINISRASNVDENALLDALERRSLGAAALDVFEDEPNIDPRFLQLENVLLQPHHASGTIETRRAMGRLLLENLRAHFSGQMPPSPVV